ncbi:hypothetical protein SHAM105786_02020 [Shewanella amazonensis]|uniref:Uncharacterized protein n=1 Tax=Shewanella amazonensis (strain ATCC BAA-1098 / SB2B) TaxID=326297 RepID=A1S7A0_SHEAM|nr:hypothetical protein [Shewanella amazonensis]ABM00257.1 conserved hypothetical protein [Shewanella amazonensis SB2B]
MSNMTKEEVISALEAALEQAEGRKVSIEQKGSWFKIDGGKSLRFAELEAMLAEHSGGAANAPKATKPEPAAKAAPKANAKPELQAEPKAAAKPKTAPKTAAKPATPPGSGGLLPKDLWKQQLLAKGNTLPRGVK